LCRAHHWAFDAGLFTLTTDHAIIVSPLAQRAESRKFEMLSLEGQRMQIPQREVIAPHRAAIEWHQSNIFRE
jgi:putative restriction endonuclease